jgi:hypothetical protein
MTRFASYSHTLQNDPSVCQAKWAGEGAQGEFSLDIPFPVSPPAVYLR